MISISVVFIIKDGEKYIRYLNEYFRDAEYKYRMAYSFEYYIYENNSKDDTRKELDNFFVNRRGYYWSEDLNINKNLNGISLQRGNYMKYLRNKLKSYHGKLETDYTLLLDCDVVLNKNTIPELLNSFEEGLVYVGKSVRNTKTINIDNSLVDNIYGDKVFKETNSYFTFNFKNDKCFIKRNDKVNGWNDELYLKSTLKNVVMVSGFDIDYSIFYENNSKNHYYDSLAFISNDDIGYIQHRNTCLFKNCEYCIGHRQRILKKRYLETFNKYLLDEHETVKVKSIFGGCCMIKTSVYNKVFWNDRVVCEHHGFCKMIREHGNIIINPNIKFSTTIPEYRNYKRIEIDLFT